MKILEAAQKIIHGIEQTVFAFSALALVGLTVLSVFMRYVLSAPLAWAEEIQMILIIWMTFFGGSIAFASKGHIAIDMITNTFSNKVQRIVDAIIWILVMVAICWILKLEFDRTVTLFSTGQATTMLKIPKAYNYSVVVFACVLMIINHLINGINDFFGLKNEGRKAADD